MKAALVSLVLAATVTGYAQSPGKSIAVGNCNIAISGNNNTVQTASVLSSKCGIGKEQADKIIQLLNTVLAKKDGAQINAKLDELIAIAQKPVQPIQTVLEVIVFKTALKPISTIGNLAYPRLPLIC